MLPWSVMPTAGMLWCAVSVLCGVFFVVLSCFVYLVWTCRWTKESFDTSENLPYVDRTGAPGSPTLSRTRRARLCASAGPDRSTDARLLRAETITTRAAAGRSRGAPVRPAVDGLHGIHGLQVGAREVSHSGRSSR